MTSLEQDRTSLEVVRCAREVYETLGGGFQEVVYKRALSIEMMLRDIEHQREFRLPLFYKNVDVGQKSVDFYVARRLPVYISAFGNLADTHVSQVKKYLEAYNLDTGLYINFGNETLEFKRLFSENYIW